MYLKEEESVAQTDLKWERFSGKRGISQVNMKCYVAQNYATTASPMIDV